MASDCRNVKYTLDAENCGICPLATVHTAVSCSNPIIDGRVCQFRAKSVVCGIIAEEFSNLVTVTLRRKHCLSWMHNIIMVSSSACISMTFKAIASYSIICT